MSARVINCHVDAAAAACSSKCPCSRRVHDIGRFIVVPRPSSRSLSITFTPRRILAVYSFHGRQAMQCGAAPDSRITRKASLERIASLFSEPTVAYLYDKTQHAAAAATRMLVINVSIPNRTVARLEQFRSPQLRFQRERPTNAGVD